MNNNTKETTEEAKKKPSEKKKQYLGMLLAIVLVVGCRIVAQIGRCAEIAFQRDICYIHLLYIWE